MGKRKAKGDVAWRSLKNKKRKTPLTWSTTATSDFLVAVHEMYPNDDILALWARLCDKQQFIYNPEAVAVLEKYIEYGEGNIIPNFGYAKWVTTNHESSNPMDWKYKRIH